MKDTYTPAGAFFDTLRREHNLKNDAALARALGLARPWICKMRHGQLPVGSTAILAIHEKLGVAVADIRKAVAA